MGLGNSTHAIYLQIVNGKIARRYKAPVPGITTDRKTTTGNIIHEQYFDHVSGFINTIKIHPPKVGFEKFGHTLEIGIVDGDDQFVLQTQRDGGYAVAFFKMLPNLDFSKRTTIIPSMKMENEKKKVTIFINQGGSGAVKHAFTKDNPGDMPPLKKVMLRGEEQWDNFDQMEFFTDMLNKKILPRLLQASSKLNLASADVPADNVTPAKTVTLNASDIEYEDLPF
jgi:hypothetical protein